MKKDEKEKWLKFLIDEFKESKIVIFAEFSGLSVKEMEQLRREVKKASCRMRVIKNNLVKKSFQMLSRDEACKFLEGPNILLWSREGDESEVIRNILKFAEGTGKVKVKFGILNHAFVENEYIQQLGKLPSKMVLQGTVIARIKSPLAALVNNIKYPVIRMILTVKILSEKKGAEK